MCNRYSANVIVLPLLGTFVMAALWNRAGHYIFDAVVSIFCLSICLFSSPDLSGRTLDVYHTWSLGHMVWPSANLEYRSETCCAQLAKNAGHKKSSKNWPSGLHRTTLSGYIFATKARIDNRKKRVKQQYLLHMSPQYGELRPTSG